MNTDDLPSDSDQSDVDYVPSDCEGKLSEEDSDENISDEPQCQEDGGLEDPGKKRKKKQKKSRKSRKVSQEEEKTEVNEETTSNKPISAEEEKKRADSLWADFMKDVGGTPKKSEPSISSTSNDHQKASEQKTQAKTLCDEKKEEKKEVEKENSRTVTEIFQFAGEEVRIQKEVASNSTIAANASCTKPPVPKTARGAKGGGLASVLGQLGKKPKLSVLEKSKLDWTEFKKDEGIEEEIQIHNKGKDGYLERQDFLQRADLRQFEIEKQLRANKRSYL